jgi:GMP synthase-like glutamine amidotransferase
MKVLIIDNNVDPPWWGASNLRVFANQIAGATVITRRGPHDDLPSLDRVDFDALVMSGSRTSCLEEAPWISNLDALVRDALNRKKPILGVCYGHQTLARVLGGRQLLRRSATPEIGWTHLRVIKPTALTAGLGSNFISYSSHFEEVFELPPGCTRIMESDRCHIQGYQLGDAPVFGIQFHPEKTLEDGKSIFSEFKDRSKYGDALLLPDQSDKVYSEKIGQAIFGNFYGLCK